MKPTLSELLDLIRRKQAEAPVRPAPKVSGCWKDVDPQPFIDGWHNR